MVGIVTVAALALFAVYFASERQQKDLSSLTLIDYQGKKTHFKVEIAVTPDQMARGLMFRESMPENEGMLFYFGGEEAERRFWMKNTLIPLDLIFIRADGRIHHIHENAVPRDLTGIPSHGPVAAVLEINGGLSKKLELFPDDRVIHPFFE